MSRAIFTIACFTFIEAARARLMRLLLLVLLAAFAGSLFLNEIAIADSQRIQTAFLAATLRPASVFVLSLFIISSLAREFNDKGLELILSLDLPRASYVLGKQLGFMGVALLLAAAVSLLLAAFAPASQAALWGLSLLGELWIVAALSLFCLLTFRRTAGQQHPQRPARDPLPDRTAECPGKPGCRQIVTAVEIATTQKRPCPIFHASMPAALQACKLLIR